MCFSDFKKYNYLCFEFLPAEMTSNKNFLFLNTVVQQLPPFCKIQIFILLFFLIVTIKGSFIYFNLLLSYYKNFSVLLHILMRRSSLERNSANEPTDKVLLFFIISAAMKSQ